MATIEEIQDLFKQNRMEFSEMLKTNLKEIKDEMIDLKKDMSENFKKLDQDINKNKKDIEECKNQIANMKIDPSCSNNVFDVSQEIEKQIKIANRIHITGVQDVDEAKQLLNDIVGEEIKPVWISAPKQKKRCIK